MLHINFNFGLDDLDWLELMVLTHYMIWDLLDVGVSKTSVVKLNMHIALT